MDKTPIQESPINQIIAFFDKYSDTKMFTVEDIKKHLSKSLPTERQFAETCFDAGSEFMHNFPKPNAISFDNFFKQ